MLLPQHHLIEIDLVVEIDAAFRAGHGFQFPAFGKRIAGLQVAGGGEERTAIAEEEFRGNEFSDGDDGLADIVIIAIS